MGHRVLLVDDDASLLLFMEKVFQREGYTVVKAQDGGSALRELESNLPDLIITDVMMPGMDGLELCRRVRAEDRWETIPFIFASVRDTADDRIAGLELGADDYVTKPLDPRELIAKARTLIARTRIYRERLQGVSPNAANQDTHTADASSESQVQNTGTLDIPATPSVLVVDDDAPMRMLMQIKLRTAGFDVRVAANGEEALREIEESAPNAIISDVSMPVMDGIALRQELLKTPHADIPFLFVTAKNDAEDVLTGLRLGVVDHIAKPVDTEILVQKTRNLIEQHQSQAKRYREQLEQAVGKVSAQLELDPPTLNGIAVAHRCIPLDVRGGDYVDYVDIPGDGVMAAIGDVMGKKWGAWFFSVAYIAYLRSVIRGSSASRTNPGAIIEQINSLLLEDLKLSEVFTTLALANIDPVERTVTWAGAGHHPPLYINHTQGTVTHMPGGGMILGVMQDQTYSDETIHLSPGDALVFFSDGITEAADEEGSMLGVDGLADFIREAGPAESASGLLNSIFEQLDAYVGAAEYADDRTILVIRVDTE
jgi:phosphoserine phosphatase RsbU/P